MGLTKQQLEALNNNSFPNNNAGAITPAILRDYNVATIANTVNQDVYTTDSASFDTRILAVDDSLVTTASFNAFTQSTNTFTASVSTSVGLLQTFSGSQYKADSASFSSRIEAVTGSVTSAITASSLITASVSQSTITFTKGDGSQFNIVVADISGGASINTGSFATTGSNTFIGNQIVSGNVNLSENSNLTVANGGFTSLQNASIKALVCTSSVTILGGGLTSTGSIVTTGDVTAGLGITAVNDISTSANVSGLNILALQASSSTFATTASFNTFTASQDFKNTTFATTGSNTFTGIQTLSDVDLLNQIGLDDHSGSLVLFAKGFTSSSLTHISASSAGVGNIIFKTNNNTVETVISGSGNIFTNASAATAGFKRYIGGSNNIYTATTIPQISASMEFSPSMNRNIGSFGVPIRGPISSSAYNINDNIVAGGLANLGTAVAPFTGMVAGYTFSNNILAGGTVNQTANKTLLDAAGTFSSNIVFGATLNINNNSSSLNYFSNIQNGGITINNNYTPTVGSVGPRRVVFANINTVYGVNHKMDIGGTNTSTSAIKSATANLLAGTYITASLEETGDNASMVATSLMGCGLIVSGTSVTPTSPTSTPNATYGTLISGRFNAVDGNKAKTAETVFAVGTGTSTTIRKTGFLIDSGSNTFVEGTLNVSGSTSTTGSITIQSGSGDLFVHGHKQFNVGAFQSNINQSGSAGVSQSMQFEVTDLSYGVTMASNSQITIANAGTYNIQFSTQLLADAGADDVYIWLKKNGTNVSATAGHVTLANNDEAIAAWNYVIDAAANDYYEIAWQSTAGDAILLAAGATGNIPSIPSIILTVTQVR